MLFFRKILSILLLFSTSCYSWEPVEKLPRESIKTTIGFVSGVRLPIVDYSDGPLNEVLEYIRWTDVPKERGVVIDASLLKLPDSTRVKIIAKDISILEATAIIAEQLGADIEIAPGVIFLIPTKNLESK